MLKTEKQTEYHDVFLTDIQMHVVKTRKPLPWYRAILKSFRNKKPGRFFTKDFSIIKKDKTFEAKISFPLPEEIRKQMEEAQKSGKKIRLWVPKNGIPVYPGKDIIEFLKSRRGKRLTNQPEEVK